MTRLMFLSLIRLVSLTILYILYFLIALFRRMVSRFRHRMISMRRKHFSRQSFLTTWLKCQGYSHEKSPTTFTNASFTTRQGETKESNTGNFNGKFAADVFSCDKHLLSGVTLRISFLRSRPLFCLIYDDDAKDYKIEI